MHQGSAAISVLSCLSTYGPSLMHSHRNPHLTQSPPAPGRPQAAGISLNPGFTIHQNQYIIIIQLRFLYFYALTGKLSHNREERKPMSAKAALEIFGYIGSALVVISMLMSSIVKLRIINTIGSIISFVYALLCGAMPLALMNICLIFINLYGLYKLLHSKKAYTLVEGTGDESFVSYFLDRYSDDIRVFFPDFTKGDAAGKKAYLVCCDDAPAGLLLGAETGGTLNILIDYSTPKYRDSSEGKYLYSVLREKNIRQLQFARKVSEGHRPFIEKMGYTEKDGKFIKDM